MKIGKPTISIFKYMFFFYKYIYTLYHQKNKNKKLDVFYHRNVIGFNIVTIEKFTSTQHVFTLIFTLLN